MGKLTHTVSGNPLIFKSADKADIESLKVYFSCIQSGSGIPSSNNVRPIIGWNDIDIIHDKSDIHIVPTSFTTETSGNATVNYLGNDTFELQGNTFTDPITVQIDINPFTLKTGKKYNLLLIMDPGGGLSNDDYALNLAFKNATKNVLIMRPNLLGWKTDLICRAFVDMTGIADEEIVKFVMGVTTGSSNFKFRLFITESEGPQYYNISWNNIAGTIYGGYVDLITGTLVSDTIMFNLQGNEEYLTYQSNTHRLRIKDFNLTYSWSSVPPISNVFKTATDNNFSVYFAATSSGNQNLNLGFPSNYTEEQARNFIAQNNVQVVCKVRNTTTYQLTPQQIKTLCGQNNIWSNTNDNIEITYEFTDHMAKRRLELNTPHIETTSASIVTFNTDMAAPIKSTKFYFTPYQLGTGTPTVENPKEIKPTKEITFGNTNNIIPFVCQENEWALGSQKLYNLNNKSFYCDGPVTSNNTLRIDVTPFILNANEQYYLHIIIEQCDSAIENNTYKLFYGLGYDNSVLGTFTATSIADGLHSATAFSLNQPITVNKLILGIPAGTPKVKFTVYITKDATQHFVIWNNTYGSICGGYLDLTTGKLIQTHYKLTFDGTEKITSVFAGAGDQFLRVQYFSSDVPKIQQGKLNNEQNTTSCKYSHGKYEMSNTIDISKGGAASNKSQTATIVLIHIPIEIYTSDNLKGDIQNYLATQYNNGTPVELCYELQNPIEYQLTPQQIKTLKGSNNIWSNANGPISVQYWTH